MGEGDAKLGIENEPSVMEDLFESIVGAIFIDSDMNMQAVIKSVASMLDMSVYTDRQKISQSAKNALQEWCADKRRRLPAPRYETLSEDGPDHKKTYMRGCYIADKLMGRGIGKNFKLADAAAAEDALKTLMAQNEQNMQTKIVKNEANSAVEPKVKSRTPASDSAKSATNEKSEPLPAGRADADKNAVSYSALLKKYATSNKKPSAVFRDLGEKRNGKSTEYAVECSFMNATAIGVGKTRPEAREDSCRLIAEELGIGKRKQKPVTQKNSAKTPVPTQGVKANDSKPKNSKKQNQRKRAPKKAVAQKK